MSRIKKKSKYELENLIYEIDRNDFTADTGSSRALSDLFQEELETLYYLMTSPGLEDEPKPKEI